MEKIAIVSKADSFGGGASRVADDISFGLRNKGYLVHHYMGWSGRGYTDVDKPLYGKYSKEIWFAQKVLKKLCLPEVFPLELLMFKKGEKIKGYDIFHFHDLSSAISPLTLLYISKTTPVIWTIHDCSPFTAGCLYPMECKNYKIGCGHCPQLGEWPLDIKFDTTRLLFFIKKLIHKDGKITLVSPSNWMAKQAYDSGLLKHYPVVIPNGVDTNIFKKLNKKNIREKLGLPTQRLIVLLSAGKISDVRKGIRFSVEALQHIRDLNPFILITGAMDKEMETLLFGLDYKSVGGTGTWARNFESR